MSKNNPRAKAAAVSFDDLDVSRARDQRQTARPSIGTAPGQAMQNAALRAELDEWKGATPVRHLDSSTVIASEWANRLEGSFKNEAFLQLKEEIRSAGGNVQPIKVRPAPGKPGFFEIIFGHRRHRACLELGLQVLAMIVDMPDLQVFEEMDQENRAREDLCAYEQGLMYDKALKARLYETQKVLAERLGVNAALVSQSIKLAKLPQEIVEAFSSPHDLQYRWAAELADAVEARREQVISIALQLANLNPRLAAKDVYTRLIRPPAEPDNSASPYSMKVAGVHGQNAKINIAPGAMKMTVSLAKVDARRAAELEAVIQAFLNS